MNLTPAQLEHVRSFGDGAEVDLAEREAIMSEGRDDRRFWLEAYQRECKRHGQEPRLQMELI